MTEQLGFEQSLGNGAEIDRDQHLVGAARAAVELARDQLLAGAVLAQDQHVRLRRRGALDQRIDAGDGRRAAEQRRLAARGRRGHGRRALALGRHGRARIAQRRGGAHRREQALVRPGLGNEVGRAALHRLDRDLDAAMGGDHHHHRFRVALQDLAEPVEALGRIGRAAAEIGVEQDDVDRPRVHRGERRVRRLERLDPLEHVAQQQPRGQENVRVVVDDDRP
jgi:hypothetical protein